MFVMYYKSKQLQRVLLSVYIINKIPVNDWYIFHRRGSEVSIKHGEELIQRFGQSKQKAFIKLINDPFYTEGVE